MRHFFLFLSPFIKRENTTISVQLPKIASVRVFEEIQYHGAIFHAKIGSEIRAKTKERREEERKESNRILCSVTWECHRVTASYFPRVSISKTTFRKVKSCISTKKFEWFSFFFFIYMYIYIKSKNLFKLKNRKKKKITAEIEKQGE